MRIKSLTIAFCALGLVASVPAVKMAILPWSGSAIAQTEPVSIEEKMSQWRAVEIEEWKICDRLTQVEGNDSFEGSFFFNDFKGITFSDEQQSAYDDLDAQAEAKRAEVYQNTLSIVDPTATLSFGWMGGEDAIPQDVLREIQAALEKNSKLDQKEALEREFGQYVEFSGTYINYASPEQEAQIDQITEDFYMQVQSIMTPEQLPQYRENLAARLRIDEVCDSWVPVSSNQDLGRVSYASDSPLGRLVDSIPEILQ